MAAKTKRRPKFRVASSYFEAEFLSSSCGAGNFNQRVQPGIRYLLRLRYRFVGAMARVSVHARLQSGVAAYCFQETKIGQFYSARQRRIRQRER